MRCGDIYLVSYPFTDHSGTKVRPVVIVSSDEFNQGDDVVVLPISSAPDSTDPYSLSISQTSPHFSATGLRCESAMKWTKPLTISRRVVQRRLGTLDHGLLADVRERLISVFS